jgi:hypothetical protein
VPNEWPAAPYHGPQHLDAKSVFPVVPVAHIFVL